MQTSESVDQIFSALAEVQANAPLVKKTGENTFHRYAYAKLEDFVTAAREPMKEAKIALIATIEEVLLSERTTPKGGIEHHALVRLALRAVHGPSGQWVEFIAWGEGQDAGDKAIYKAITGARKYAMASALGLATTDDPETESPEGAKAKAKAPEPSPASKTETVRRVKPLPARVVQDRAPEEEDAIPMDHPTTLRAGDKWFPSPGLLRACQEARNAGDFQAIMAQFAEAAKSMSHQGKADAWKWIKDQAFGKSIIYDAAQQRFVDAQPDGE